MYKLQYSHVFQLESKDLVKNYSEQQIIKITMRSRSNIQIRNPQRIQQWAIINKQRALENQHIREMKRLEQYNKKMKFKHDLDMQLSTKNNIHQFEQQSDKYYLQFIIKKAQEQKERQDRQRKQRIEKRKRIQQQNIQALNQLKNSRPKHAQPQYTLDIGVKSQILQRQRQKKGIKQMKDTLDLQIRQKQQQMNRAKSKQLRNCSGVSLIDGESVNPALAKNYGQNINIYHTYEKLQNQRKKQQEQLYRRITQQAAYKIQQQSRQRIQNQRRRKQQLTSQMLHTLDDQLKDNKRRRSQQKNGNPEEMSFRFISDLFREKPAAYDKNKYYQQLRKQAYEQKQRKKHEKYMNEEQYKINMNQLNSIVNGSYMYKDYVDRSLNNIGADKIKEQPFKSYGESSQIIRNQLQKIKYNRPKYNSRMQNSFS